MSLDLLPEAFMEEDAFPSSPVAPSPTVFKDKNTSVDMEESLASENDNAALCLEESSATHSGDETAGSSPEPEDSPVSETENFALCREQSPDAAIGIGSAAGEYPVPNAQLIQEEDESPQVFKERLLQHEKSLLTIYKRIYGCPRDPKVIQYERKVNKRFREDLQRMQFLAQIKEECLKSIYAGVQQIKVNQAKTYMISVGIIKGDNSGAKATAIAGTSSESGLENPMQLPTPTTQTPVATSLTSTKGTSVSRGKTVKRKDENKFVDDGEIPGPSWRGRGRKTVTRKKPVQKSKPKRKVSSKKEPLKDDSEEGDSDTKERPETKQEKLETNFKLSQVKDLCLSEESGDSDLEVDVNALLQQEMKKIVQHVMKEVRAKDTHESDDEEWEEVLPNDSTIDFLEAEEAEKCMEKE